MQIDSDLKSWKTWEISQEIFGSLFNITQLSTQLVIVEMREPQGLTEQEKQ